MVKLTPPMGWNSWNTFGAKINEDLIREIADTMISSGLKAAGYEYVVIDDAWGAWERGVDGRLHCNTDQFPGGMKTLADYIHSKGLKFGMYSSSGHRTCLGIAASYDYEFEDAETFASWGVDFLKYDFCHRPSTLSAEYTYRKMGAALANSGRDILFSACSWGMEETCKWIKTTGASMWRSTGDINDSWESIRDLAVSQIELQPYNGIGCFNDMDMLVVGMNGKGNVGVNGCSFEEYKTHFSLWAFLNSPLMIGCDIRNMTDETKRILMNREIIALNQDAAGHQPYIVGGIHTMFGNRNYVWVKLLNNGDFAIGMFNLEDTPALLSFSAVDIGLSRVSGKKLALTDLWTGESVPMLGSIELSESLPPHGCKIMRGRVINS